MDEEQAFEKIIKRRRQLHLHSVIYYKLNESVVTDAQWDAWAAELVSLNKQYPQYLHKGYMHHLFDDFTGDTGMHLESNPGVLALAKFTVLRHRGPK